MLVRDIMTPYPYHVSAMDQVSKAYQLMTNANIKHLLVIDRGILIGIISINDIPKYIKPQLTVAEIMSVDPVCVQINDSIEYARELLSRFKIASLPVLDGSRVAGIVTVYDILK